MYCSRMREYWVEMKMEAICLHFHFFASDFPDRIMVQP